jgi:hypothetical protein
MLAILLVILFIVILIAALCAGKKIGELEGGDVEKHLQQVDHLMRSRGWTTNLSARKGKMKIKKDSLVAAIIRLKQNKKGTIDLIYSPSTTVLGWILVLFLGGIGLIIAIILHVMSSSFARNEVLPMIRYYPLGTGPINSAPMMPQVYGCQNCGQPLSYSDPNKRWFCNNCKRYV